jgi:hypothetical protein
MASNKERYQNPNKGDTITLRGFFYNLNSPTDLFSIDDISIYRFDREEVTEENPDGRVLVKTIDVSTVVHDGTGQYHVDVPLSDPDFGVGHFCDVWSVTYLEGDKDPWVNTYEFQVYPKMLYSTPIPVVYDFSFRFQPNKIRKGSKQFIRIEVIPNVPRASDLARYYENLAIVGDIQVSIELQCGPCVPAERDLRMVVENAPVDFREKCYGYYKIDTTDLDCGIYNVWFTLNLGDNTYVSDKMALQIFD